METRGIAGVPYGRRYRQVWKVLREEVAYPVIAPQRSLSFSPLELYARFERELPGSLPLRLAANSG